MSNKINRLEKDFNTIENKIKNRLCSEIYQTPYLIYSLILSQGYKCISIYSTYLIIYFSKGITDKFQMVIVVDEKVNFN
jgi:hypothetical protein